MPEDDLEHIRGRLAAREPIALTADEDMKRAAVAAILRPGPSSAEVLFIRRAEHPGDPWSGHMAFPGGRQDPGDVALLDTARRETLEEIGLDLSRAELLGRLDDLQAVARGVHTDLLIRPFVFALEGEPPLPSGPCSGARWTPCGPTSSPA